MSADEEIARTLAQAGARPVIAAELAATVRRNVESAWRESLSVRRGQRRRRRSLLAAAALLVGVGVASIGWRIAHRAAPAFGVFLAARGSVDIRSPHAAPIAVGGMPLIEGTRVRTGPAGRALLAIGDTSIRIAPDSVVTFERADRIRLEAGRIYLDFGSHDAPAGELALVTPFGSIEHLGTQFQAELRPLELTVSVREGHVRLLSGRGEQLVGAREAARVGATGTTRIESIATSGALWAWTTALAPDFPIEGRSLAEFLSWYARETGKRIDYASPEIRVAAQQTRLSGSIAGLTPDDALTAILASTPFEYSVLDNGGVRVTKRGEAHAKLHRDGMDWLETRISTQD